VGEGSSRIESIERINLTGSGNNTLKLSLSDVLDMTSMNWLNSSTAAGLGVTGGSYTLGSREAYHQLIIDGDAGDVLLGPASLSLTGHNVLIGGQSYELYLSSSTNVQLFIDSQVTVQHTTVL
jgi:hypothetical protein